MLPSEKEILRSLCLESYYDFFIEFWQCLEAEPLADNWHIKYLCDELQEIAERLFLKDKKGKGKERLPLKNNLIINISPGETKSSISTIFFPVWLWLRDPTLRIITLSYSTLLSFPHAQRSRDLIDHPKFEECFGDIFQLRRDMNAVSQYGVMYGPDMKNVGGIRITSSVGGTITGKHAHIIIVDDPVKPDEAYSDVVREGANNFMKRTLNTRKVDVKLTPTILVMQRLHEEDPTATMAKIWKKQGKLKWLRLPADDRYNVIPQELIENYVQDGKFKVMNMHRKPTEVIEDMEAEMLAADFAGQLGQDPQPSEGNIIKGKWLEQRFKAHELVEKLRWEHREVTLHAVLDGAYTKVKTNSATGCLVFAQVDGKLYLYDYREWWLEFHELIPAIVEFLGKYFTGKQNTLYVEPKGPGKSIIQVIRSKGRLNIVEDPLPDGVTSMEGKELRTRRSAPFLQGMNTFFNESVDWDSFIKQCKIFPNGSHSDLVDCLNMAVEKVDFGISDIGDLISIS